MEEDHVFATRDSLFFFFCELNIIHVTQNVNEKERGREREREEGSKKGI